MTMTALSNVTPLNPAAQQFPIRLTAEFLPETLSLLEAAPTMLREASSITIGSDEALQTAADQLQRIKGAIKSINEQRTAITKPIDEAKKKVMDYVRAPLESLESAESLIKNAIVDYQNTQEALRREQEAKAAEKSRCSAEKLEAKADRLEEQGKVEQAEALRENAAMQVAAPSPIVSATKVAGVSTRKAYSAKVVDLMALCKSVAAQALLMEAAGDPAKLIDIVRGYAMSNTPIQALTADTKFLNQQAKAFKEAFNYPGCQLVAETGVASRAK